jgi:hypothetical protein
MSRPMPARNRREQELVEKIRSLSPDKLAELEDLVDFLRRSEQEGRLAKAVTGASEAAFAKVWDNADDAEHDQDRAERDTKARAVIEELRAMRRGPVREDVLYDEQGQPRL